MMADIHHMAGDIVPVCRYSFNGPVNSTILIILTMNTLDNEAALPPQLAPRQRPRMEVITIGQAREKKITGSLRNGFPQSRLPASCMVMSMACPVALARSLCPIIHENASPAIRRDPRRCPSA